MSLDQQYHSRADLPDASPPSASMSDSLQSSFEFMKTVETLRERSFHESSLNTQGADGQRINDASLGRQHSEVYYRALVELAVDGMMVGNRDGVVVDANEALCAIFGLERGQIVGKHVSKLPFTVESLEQKPFRFESGDRGKIVITERVLVRPDSSRVTVEMRSREMSDGVFHWFVRDITERKREEAALRESEDRYRQLFEAESDALFLIDNEAGQIIEANSAASVLYGYSREELISMRNVDLSAEPEATQRATHGAPRFRDQIISIPLRFHRKVDGTVFPVEITARSFMQAGRSVHIAAIRDITERQRAEDELLEREERLRQLAETLEVRVLNRTRELETANLALMQNVSQLRKLAMDLTQAEERERKRLALLLHDHLQPFLVAATMKISLLGQPMPADEQSQTVQTTLDLINSAMKASRSLTTDLYPPILLDAGLMPGLRWLADWIKDNYGLSVEIKGNDALEVPDTLGILVFQTIRELLYNMAKHAKSEVAVVSIAVNSDQILHIVVEDQGVGFAGQGSGFPMSSSGLGLFHVRERIGAVGGTFEVENTDGHGAKVSVCVPLMTGQLKLDLGGDGRYS